MNRRTILVLAAAVLLVPGLKATVEQPDLTFMIPWYEASPDPGGPTTLFSIRNASTAQSARVNISYFNQQGQFRWAELVTLGPEEVYTRNVRDVVEHLDTDTDGFSRGLITIAPQLGMNFTSDYFFIDNSEAFASGARSVHRGSAGELCELTEVRFVEGGPFTGGTDLFIDHYPDEVPAGQPAFWIEVYGEDGVLRTVLPRFEADLYALKINTADLAYPNHPVAGFIKVRFNNPLGGHLSAKLSAEGIYSITMKGVCLIEATPP